MPRPKFRTKKERPEFDQQILDLARVTRVTKGGKQLSFRATVVIGDHKGRVGYGIEKGKDVQLAVQKAVNQAKKNIITVPIVKDTIPHRVEIKFKAARVMMKPAPKGSGIIAGSSLRAVLEMAGVPNASGKLIGRTNNKVTNVKAAFQALQMLRVRPPAGSVKKREHAVSEQEAAIGAAASAAQKASRTKSGKNRSDEPSALA